MAKRQRSTYVLPVPDWKKFKEYTDEADRVKAFSDCEYFVHYEVQEKSGVAPLKKWMKENWSAEDMQHISKLPDSRLVMFGKYGYVWSKLGYMTEAHVTYLNSIKDDLVQKAKEIVVEKEEAPKAPVVPIRSNLNDFINMADDTIDVIVRNGKVNVTTLIDNAKLNAAELSKAYTELDVLATEFRELEIARSSEDGDSDLIEGYSHLKKSTLKNILAYFNDLQTGLLETKQSKKIVRIKRKRPTDKTKLVRKLKYLPEFAELNLKSLNPVDIIGASEVWVYDVKRKKLGVYASDYEGTLGVKGTSIDNYSDAKSYEKTLRKPEVQMPEFMAARKNGLHKFVDTVRGKKLAARKRLLPDMVIVRII